MSKSGRFSPLTGKQPGVVRLNADIFSRVVDLARKEDRPVSAMVNRLVRAALAQYEQRAIAVPEIQEEQGVR